MNQHFLMILRIPVGSVGSHNGTPFQAPLRSHPAPSHVTATTQPSWLWAAGWLQLLWELLLELQGLLLLPLLPPLV